VTGSRRACAGLSAATASVSAMIQNVTDIIIACAAAIGLVPVGLRALRDLIRNRQKKKTSDQLAIVALSILGSMIAPSLLETVGRHLAAAGAALPDWIKAAPTQTVEPSATQAPAGDTGNGKVPTPTIPAP
jgi:hypothetical protein